MMETIYYHKISDLMVRIVRSSYSCPAIFTMEKALFTDLSSISFHQISKNDIWNDEILTGYQRVNHIESAGEFSRVGDTIILHIANSSFTVRVELFGNSVEKISLLDNLSLRKIKDLSSFHLPSPIEIGQDYIIDYDLEKSPAEILNFYTEKNLNIPEKYFSLPIYVNKQKLWEMDLARYVREDFSLSYYGQNVEQFKNKIKDDLHELIRQKMLISDDVKIFAENIICHDDNSADKGFYSNSNKVITITDQEIFGTLFFKSILKNENIGKLFDGEIKIGDYIVHDLHGVGIYQGIVTKKFLNDENDYIKIEYLGNDYLYVPYASHENISRFIGEGESPKLTRLGSAEWDAVRKKAKKAIEEIADELLDLYARRELEKGFAFDIEKSQEGLDEIVSEFGFQDTPDQQRSTQEILQDMQDEKPMDRLLVGDVGFGKTEIAVRSAFIAVYGGKQVMVLAPTTILVSQLYKVFSERLAKHGVKISKVSRFEGINKNKESIQKFNFGSIDILVGTHRLLSNDLSPKNLGLLIIDEEQRFGVKQKEKIKNIKSNIDVLSMSATPIPRTLQMSLTGIRDISIISTPPAGRLSVITNLLTRQEIYEPIINEINRGGQVFIVHNNISTIYSLEEKIKEKIPGIKIIVGHAKMTGQKLEKVMLDFADKKFDVLIATTIIENGIDIPTVNTMIINEANNFGLSQLHQLRGRVGRSTIQAYCYLVVPYILNKGSKDFNKIKKATKKYIDLNDDPEEKNFYSENNKKNQSKKITIDGIERIKAIMEYQSLGAGFQIASKDLEIRGGGNILSSSQSGHINTIGYDMYLRMLYQEIERKKHENNHVKI